MLPYSRGGQTEWTFMGTNGARGQTESASGRRQDQGDQETRRDTVEDGRRRPRDQQTRR